MQLIEKHTRLILISTLLVWVVILSQATYRRWDGSRRAEELSSRCGTAGDEEKAVGVRAWRNLPIKMKFASSVPEDAKPAILAAANKWSETLGTTAFEFESSEVDEVIRDGQSIISWVREQHSRPVTEQAYTTTYWYTGEISESDIQINNRDYSMALDHPRSPLELDLQSLMIHEFGHVLGLFHFDDEGVMNPALARATERREIGDTVASRVRCLYANQIPKRTVESISIASIESHFESKHQSRTYMDGNTK